LDFSSTVVLNLEPLKLNHRTPGVRSNSS